MRATEGASGKFAARQALSDSQNSTMSPLTASPDARGASSITPPSHAPIPAPSIAVRSMDEFIQELAKLLPKAGAIEEVRRALAAADIDSVEILFELDSEAVEEIAGKSLGTKLAIKRVLRQMGSRHF
jgi:hypothetical protein